VPTHTACSARFSGWTQHDRRTESSAASAATVPRRPDVAYRPEAAELPVAPLAPVAPVLPLAAVLPLGPWRRMFHCPVAPLALTVVGRADRELDQLLEVVCTDRFVRERTIALRNVDGDVRHGDWTRRTPLGP